ncbi:hypothetical protein EMPS_03205 [Entomortierella parvispora]|uniref:non-specific serine/threonine protein kinase n=1 Tax=Entomortierella parvispora TaxID=205924 RepID=A0A9P3LUN6_9FUNG|nr:hypothetical protein EMPS_03205 [Entomortierella parvispora]
MGSSSTVIGGEYLVLGKIGEGSFGEVFRATHQATGVDYAIKREPINVEHPQLGHEAKMYERLAGGAGIPRMHWYGREGSYNALVIDLLGPNLKQVRRENEKFPLSFVIELGVQIITQLEFIHKQGIVYRDVKPENFLLDDSIVFPEAPAGKTLTPPIFPDHIMSFFNDTRRRQHSIESTHSTLSNLSSSPTSPILLGYGKPKLFIVDFGLATFYRDPSGKHMHGRGTVRHKVGTARYASLNIHNGREHSRRDDIESVGYMLLEFLIGTLPWSGIAARNSKQGWAKMKEIKEEIELDELCEGLPRGFMTFIGYARGLVFDEEPDYDYLRKILTSSAGRGAEAQTVRFYREPAGGVSRSLENCFSGLHIQQQHPAAPAQEIPIKKSDPFKTKERVKDNPLENWRKRPQYVPAEKAEFQDYNPESLWTTTPPDVQTSGEFSIVACNGDIQEDLKDQIDWEIVPENGGEVDPSHNWGEVDKQDITEWGHDDGADAGTVQSGFGSYPPFNVGSFPGDSAAELIPHKDARPGPDGLGLQFARQSQHAPQDARLYSNEPPFGLLPPSARVAAFTAQEPSAASTVNVAASQPSYTRNRQYSREYSGRLGIDTSLAAPVHPLARDSAATKTDYPGHHSLSPKSLSSSFSSINVRSGQEVEPGIEHSQRGYPVEASSPVKVGGAQQHHPSYHGSQDRAHGRSHRPDNGWEGDRLNRDGSQDEHPSHYGGGHRSGSENWQYHRQHPQPQHPFDNRRDRWRPAGGGRPGPAHGSIDGSVDSHEWNHGRRSRQVSAPGSRFQGAPSHPSPNPNSNNAPPLPLSGSQRPQWGIPPFGSGGGHHPPSQQQQSYPPKYHRAAEYDQSHSQGGGGYGYNSYNGGYRDQRRRSSRSRKCSNTSLQETFKSNNMNLVKNGGSRVRPK